VMLLAFLLPCQRHWTAPQAASPTRPAGCRVYGFLGFMFLKAPRTHGDAHMHACMYIRVHPHIRTPRIMHREVADIYIYIFIRFWVGWVGWVR
jgi:hypothetical protein